MDGKIMLFQRCAKSNHDRRNPKNHKHGRTDYDDDRIFGRHWPFYSHFCAVAEAVTRLKNS